MSLIIYEAKLTWYKNYNIPLDKLQNIVRDVNSFAPEVPVQNIKSLFIFSVNENKKSINTKTTAGFSPTVVVFCSLIISESSCHRQHR